MFGKLKQFVGIVGVDVRLDVEQQLSYDDSSLSGVVHLSAKQEQGIAQIKVKMTEERYEGSGEHRHTYEYLVDETVVSAAPFTIKPGESKDYPFTLNFHIDKPAFQSMSEHGGVLGAVGAVGKFMTDTDSYWVQVVADVQGAALDPHDRKELFFH